MRHTVAAVNELRHRLPDVVVLAAHDPGAADRLAAALFRIAPADRVRVR